MKLRNYEPERKDGKPYKRKRKVSLLGSTKIPGNMIIQVYRVKSPASWLEIVTPDNEPITIDYWHLFGTLNPAIGLGKWLIENAIFDARVGLLTIIWSDTTK